MIINDPNEPTIQGHGGVGRVIADGPRSGACRSATASSCPSPAVWPVLPVSAWTRRSLPVPRRPEDDSDCDDVQRHQGRAGWQHWRPGRVHGAARGIGHPNLFDRAVDRAGDAPLCRRLRAGDDDDALAGRGGIMSPVSGWVRSDSARFRALASWEPRKSSASTRSRRAAISAMKIGATACSQSEHGQGLGPRHQHARTCARDRRTAILPAVGIRRRIEPESRPTSGPESSSRPWASTGSRRRSRPAQTRPGSNRSSRCSRRCPPVGILHDGRRVPSPGDDLVSGQPVE